MNFKEQWKDIEGYEGLYEISTYGNVRSKERKSNSGKIIKEKILKQEVTKNNRCLVKLSKDGKTKKYQVHVLVAKHFIDNPYFYNEVNHIDENTLNNNVNNLEWCTGWYNNCYSFSKHVLCEYTLDKNERKFYESVNATTYDGFNKGHVGAVCRGEESQHKGYVFKYVKDEKYIIGIDESYARCGITLLCDKVIVEMFSISYENCLNNTEKRNEIKKELNRICKEYRLDKRNCDCIIERIRLKSQGVLSLNYILATSALVSTITDTLCNYKIKVYSVNTKSWKSAIVGTSKPLDNPYGINPEKYRTICYLRDKGLLKHIVKEYKGKGKKGIIDVKMEVTEGSKKVKKKVPCEINDDLADSYCIALYGYLPKSKQKLKEERF